MNIKIYLILRAGLLAFPLLLITDAEAAFNRLQAHSIASRVDAGRHLRITISDPYHYSRAGLMLGKLKHSELASLWWVEPNIQMIGIDYPIVSLGAGYRYMKSKDQIRGIYAYYDINNLFPMVRDHKPIAHRITLGGEMLGRNYHISGNLHVAHDVKIALLDRSLPLQSLDNLENSPTKLGFNIKASLRVRNNFFPSIGYYYRKVQRRAFLLEVENPAVSILKKISRDYLVVDKKHGIVGGVQYTYNPVHSVAINFIYDNLTKCSMSCSYQFKLDGYSQSQPHSFYPYLWKPVEYQIGPTLDRYIAPDRSAYRQRVKDLLEDRNPMRDQLADEFDKNYSIALRKEAAGLWLNLDKEKREQILTLDHEKFRSLPFELKLDIVEKASSGDRVGELREDTTWDEMVLTGYMEDWRPQLHTKHLRVFMEHYRSLQSTSLKRKFIELKGSNEDVYEFWFNYF
jgi:hypothetical protein